MKLLHVCTGWPLSYKGGITNYVRSLAISQHKEGEEVYVLGAPDEERYEFHYIPYTSSIVPFTFTPLIDKAALASIRKLLEEEKFDIIHLHALEYIDWDIYTVLKGHPYVVSLHDYCFICPRIYMYSIDKTVCERYDKSKCGRCVSFLDRFSLLRRGVNKINRTLGTSLHIPYIKQNITSIRYQKFSELLNHADYILPVSQKVEEIYRASGIVARSKVLHIGNISADGFSEEYTYSTEPHIIKIVFLGRLTNYKGADLFIELANALKEENNIKFYFLGSAGEYADKIEKAGVINQGRYSPDELPELLKQFDMGMVLSIWHDNGPQVVMELLNNRIPVIGTKMGGITDFVNEENGFVFDPYSKKEIEAAITFIRNLTPNQINELKKNIRRTTTTKEHYDQLMDIYHEVLLDREK